MPLQFDPGDLERYGLNEDGLLVDPSGLDRFIADNPDWGPFAGDVLSWEASIIADLAGVGPPDTWGEVTIWADGDTWGVTIDGVSIEMALDEVWDYYDAAAYFDYDVEKDIDTGGTPD